MLAGQVRRARTGEQELGNGARRAAKGADLAVAPGLLSDPFQRVVAVPMVRPAVGFERQVITLRGETPARVLNHGHVAVARALLAGTGGDQLIVGRPGEQYRKDPVG